MKPAPSIGCVLMASGQSRRFGANKLLAEYEGVPLVIRALRALPADAFASVVVVTRYPEIVDIARVHGFDAICRPAETLHPSGTIREGLAALRMPVDGCCFMVADQPLLRAESVRRLADAFRAEPDHIWALGHAGRKGNPIIFPENLFMELMALAEHESGSAIIQKHPSLLRILNIDDPNELTDIDTLQDLRTLSRKNKKEP